jgi:hypothetical protein
MMRGNTRNPRDLRNGSLMFWQLSAPNLIPEHVQVAASDKNPFVNNSLAKMAA